MPELTVAQRIHNDIWDLFGTLTRDQSLQLQTYLDRLEETGVIKMPVLSTGSVDTKQPGDQPEPRADQTE